MEYFLITIIALSAVLVPSASGASQAAYKEIFAHFAIVSFLAFWVWKYNKWLALFLAWAIIQLIFGKYQSRALISFSNIMLGCIVYMGVRQLKPDKIKIFKALLLFASLQIAVVFLQKVNLFMFWNSNDLGAWGANGRVWGLFGNSNWSGCFIAITLPLFLDLYDRERKKYYLVGAIAAFIALFIMQSMFAIVSGIAGVLFYLYFRLKINPLFWLGAILLATAAFIIHPVYFNDGGRFEVWERVWRLCTFGGFRDWGCHFVQGFGLGSTYEILPTIMGPKDLWFQVHNEPLQVLMEFGLVGVVIVGGLIFSMFRMFKIQNIALYACMIALLCECLGFFPFRASPIGYIGVMYMGMIDEIL